PPKPAAPQTNQASMVFLTNALGTNLPPEVLRTQVFSTGEARITMPSSPSAGWQRPNEPEETVVLETPEARYTFTSHGGGIKKVELPKYPEIISKTRKNRRQQSGGAESITNRVVTLNHGAPVPAMALLGGQFLAPNESYSLTKTTNGVRAEKEIPGGLKIVKEFWVHTNGLLACTITLTNTGTGPIAIPATELVFGTATPLDPYDQGQAVKVEWYDGRATHSADEAWFANRGFLGCLPASPRSEYFSPGESNVVWASVQNQFFAMALIPAEVGPKVVARPVDLPGPSPEERAQDSRLVARPRGYQAAIIYAPQLLQSGEQIRRVFQIYAGPKEYDTLVRYGNDLDLIMGFSGFFGWIARILLVSMNGLHALGLSYGAAIIAITVIIKILFWPLTQASTRSMKKMQMLQPQMKAIQEKYKDDPKKMNMKLMEFMKEHRVSPLGGCLPILLQIPVFIGLYQMLRSAIELRGARFLWAADLSQPDTVAVVFGIPINPLPLIMGATQLWQARLTPPSPGMDPVQQKIMQYMPLIFVVMLYNFSAGLALYWTVQNLLSILQMKLTKALPPQEPLETPVGARRRPKRH
ncbi:MAG: membrane protein insertase YidC, partial [Verrucomicrobiae bacterium]|nr:membrane protein insertase YidC [Verrucomicrobiae bacterium]